MCVSRLHQLNQDRDQHQPKKKKKKSKDFLKQNPITI